MRKKSFLIELPLFCGFYESPFLNADTLHYEVCEEESMEYYKECFGEDITEDDLDFDYPSLKEDLCKEYCKTFYNYIQAFVPDFMLSCEFSGMTSPKEYNYVTNKLYANVDFADDWQGTIRDFFEENEDWLRERIHDDWTSSDGFWSFMDNNYDVWIKELTSEEPDERYITEALKYIMYMHDKNVQRHIISDTLLDFNYGTYVICTKNKEA